MASELKVREKKIFKRRVVIVDKHPLLRRGLSELINNEPELEVSAVSGTPSGALDAISACQPDLVITGLSLSDGIGDGIALVADIRSKHEDLPILVLSMHDGARYAERAKQAGASDFLSKQEIDGTLLVAIHKVLDGKPHGKFVVSD